MFKNWLSGLFKEPISIQVYQNLIIQNSNGEILFQYSCNRIIDDFKFEPQVGDEINVVTGYTFENYTMGVVEKRSIKYVPHPSLGKTLRIQLNPIVRKLKTERFETEDPTWSRKILRYIDDHRVYCDYTVKNEEFILNRIKELVELVDAIEFLEKQ